MLDLGIVILVDDEFKAKAEMLSTEIQGVTKIDTSYSQNNHPHITLFQNRFSDEKFGEISEKVREICTTYTSFEVTFHSALFLSKFNNVFWNLEKTSQLTKLHEGIVDALNPLREGLTLPRYEECLNNSDASEIDKDNIRSYGVILVRDRWIPHMTILKLDRDSFFDEIEHIKPPPPLQMSVGTIALGRIGYHGELVEILEKVDLSRKQYNKSLDE